MPSQFDGARLAPRASVTRQQPLADAFVAQVLGLNPSHVLLTDASTLSDFEGAGGLDGEEWAASVLARIELFFGVRLASTDIRMVDIFASIESFRRLNLH